MNYAKYNETPLPIGTSHLRINRYEINASYGETPVLMLSIERRTVLSDGTHFGTQLDSVSIPLEGKIAEVEVLDRMSGERKKDAAPLSIADFADSLFSLGHFAMSARDAAHAAEEAAQDAQALADRLRDDPMAALDR